MSKLCSIKINKIDMDDRRVLYKGEITFGNHIIFDKEILKKRVNIDLEEEIKGKIIKSIDYYIYGELRKAVNILEHKIRRIVPLDYHERDFLLEEVENVRKNLLQFEGVICIKSTI